MRDQFALAADGIGLLLIVGALWLVAYRRSVVGTAMGMVGVSVLAAMASLRALPSPTRAELNQMVAALEQTRAKLALDTERLEKDISRANTEMERVRAKAKADLVAARSEAQIAAFDRLIAALATGNDQRRFALSPIADDEIIEGLKGTYLAISIRDPRTRGPLTFESGSFVLAGEAEAAMLQAIRQLETQILNGIPQSLSARLLIRGGADAEPYARSDNPGAEFGELSFRTLGQNQKYGPADGPRRFPSQVDNSHLPQLRAAFFRAYLLKHLDVPREVELLHNVPTLSLSAEHRTIQLILYIKHNA